MECNYKNLETPVFSNFSASVLAMAIPMEHPDETYFYFKVNSLLRLTWGSNNLFLIPEIKHLFVYFSV